MNFNKSSYLRIAIATLVYFMMKLRLVGKVWLPGIKSPFKVRKGTSDTGTFRQVFKEDQYRFKLENIRTIVDAGANIGLASIIFGNKYPQAQISAIEPDKGNFELMKRNVAPYQVKTFRAGVWNKSTNLEVKDNGHGAWAYTVEEVEHPTEDSISGISINDVMDQSGFERIDLLKIDIEGSEREVFAEGYDRWLPKTRYIIIELHDGMRKGASTSVFKAISEFNFSFESRRKNLLFTNQDLKQGLC